MSLLVRLLAAAACILVAARCLRIARADWLVGVNTPASVAEAIRMEPADGSLLASAAIYRSDNGDLSASVDRDLLRASQLNPLDSRVPMALGLRAEFRGEAALAENYLRRAVELDKQFKPSWTLANFYFRHDQPEKAWPLLRHCLELEPLGFDADPVFDLCWNAQPDPAKILALVPKRNPRLLQYLAYLVRRNHPAEAAQVWPDALSLVSRSSAEDTGILKPLPDFLARGGHAEEAIRVWNGLVERGMVRGAPLDPAHGKSFADPGFSLGVTESRFGWTAAEPPGVFASNVESSLRFEMDGNEPEVFDLADTTAAVLPSRNYKLTWGADSEHLSLPEDPGFFFRIRPVGDAASNPDPAAKCPPLLAARAEACQFSTGPATRLLQLTLSYSRAPGTTRPHGSFLLHNVRLTPQ